MARKIHAQARSDVFIDPFGTQGSVVLATATEIDPKLDYDLLFFSKSYARFAQLPGKGHPQPWPSARALIPKFETRKGHARGLEHGRKMALILSFSEGTELAQCCCHSVGTYDAKMLLSKMHGWGYANLGGKIAP